MSNVADLASLIARNEELSEALRNANRKLASLRASRDELVEAVSRAALEAGLAVKAPPVPRLKPSKRAEVALLHLTDWQRGKRTESYDSEVCDKRVMLAVAKAIEITELHRESVPVSDCVLMLGGDMVEGVSIFPGQPWEVDSTLFEQLFGVSALIQSAVHALLGVFKTVTVVEEFGNHGRIGRRGELPSNDNIDLIAYRVAEQGLPVDGVRLTWQRASSWHQIVEVGAYRAMLVHGDEIRSYGGNHPVYGIVRKVSSWQAGVVAPFMDCYMGHFHRPDTYTLPAGGNVYLTGSPESGNEYAREFLAATGRPSQRLHFVDPQRGRVTAEFRLWLD